MPGRDSNRLQSFERTVNADSTVYNAQTAEGKRQSELTLWLMMKRSCGERQSTIGPNTQRFLLGLLRANRTPQLSFAKKRVVNHSTE